VICIAELNKRLIIETPVRTPDGCGGSDVSWTPTATIWAKLKPRGLHERLDSDQVSATMSHVITIRHRTGLSTKDRFRLETRVFDILSIVNAKEQNRWLECTCREQLP
jgi:SPP1 family predicted phage head-tail adaptor